MKEIYFLRDVNDTNIVTLLGVILEKETTSIVMEWAPDGSLYDYLRRKGDERYDKLEIVSITDCFRFNQLK